MPLQARPSALSTWPPRAEFVLEHFLTELEQHGYDVRWSKAIMCPNRDPNQEDHHKLNCQYCDNAGYIYYDPIETKALVTSFGLQQLFMPESRYHPGTAYFTLRSDQRLSFWDKVELIQSKIRFTQVVKSTTAVKYKLKYDAGEIVQVVSSAGMTVPSDLYRLDTGGILFGMPPSFPFFSVSYTYHPAYIILDLMHVIRSQRVTNLGKDEETEFPLQAMGRLDFLVRDEAAT